MPIVSSCRLRRSECRPPQSQCHLSDGGGSALFSPSVDIGRAEESPLPVTPPGPASYLGGVPHRIEATPASPRDQRRSVDPAARRRHRRSRQRDRRRSAAPKRQHRARSFPHHVLRRRAKEPEIGRSPSLDTHDDQIALSFCGDAQNFAPGLPMGHQRLHAAELGRGRDGFLKTPAESFFTLLHESPRWSCLRRLNACHVVSVLEFVPNDMQHSELTVGFLRHRGRVFQCVQRRL